VLAVSEAEAGAEVCVAGADVDAEVVPELGAVGDAAAGLVLGVLLGVVLEGGALGELDDVDGVGDGELDEGDGVGDGELDEGDGVGVGVLVAGSTWQLVAVFALAEVPGLGEAAGRSTAARATPGRPTSTTRVSTLSITARTCASRMKNALVSATHQDCWLLFVGSEATR
jgi:hypothetical protein